MMGFKLLNSIVIVYADPDTFYLVSARSCKNAVSFLFQVASVKFISLTYIMMDIIPHVSKLSLFFQKENVDLALVKVS